MKINMSEVDTFYISYDEPKCEENWADLVEKAPWAKRVHGVKGFDSAHKACAMQSETERFITVDGDNIVDSRFFDMSINIPIKYENHVLSWNSVNGVNGLVYGNGGLKLWTKDWVMKMRSHENATNEAEKLDFCWDSTYLQLNSIWSTTYPNGSAFQAFRAGFREGVKMTLDRGAKVDKVKMQSIVHDTNFKRLLIWSCVGADVENGLYSILGTRTGIYCANIEEGFDLSLISDYDWFKTYWLQIQEKISNCDVEENIKQLIDFSGTSIKHEMGVDLCLYTPEQSKFFKQVYEHKQLQYAENIEKEFFAGF
jgi:hypothetical protein